MKISNFLQRIFVFDMDGVLAEYRYKDSSKFISPHDRDIGFFSNLRPVKKVVNFLDYLIEVGDPVFILSNVGNSIKSSISQYEKIWWLSKNVNGFEKIPKNNLIFCKSDDSKTNWMEIIYSRLIDLDYKFYNTQPITRDRLVLIDDTHKILDSVERKDFKAWHVSTLLVEIEDKI